MQFHISTIMIANFDLQTAVIRFLEAHDAQNINASSRPVPSARPTKRFNYDGDVRFSTTARPCGLIRQAAYPFNFRNAPTTSSRTR